MKYAKSLSRYKECQEEHGYHYASKDFQVRTFTGTDYIEFATVFWKDYIFPNFTFEKMREFANYLDAYANGIWDDNLTLVVLECIKLKAVKEGLECAIYVIDEEGNKQIQKPVLSKVECFSISKNINHYLDDFSSRGKTLMIDLPTPF